MTKTKLSERAIINAGYKIEYCISPRGNKLVKAFKDTEKTIYATNLISLCKTLNLSNN